MDKKKSFQALAEMDLSERRETLIDYFSKWADIGDSYIFDLTRVKEAFAIGTMGLEDFQEWDEERITLLVDELLEAFPQEGPAFVWAVEDTRKRRSPQSGAGKGNRSESNWIIRRGDFSGGKYGVAAEAF